MRRVITSGPRARRKGTAYVEALLTLPVFAAVFAGILAFNSMYAAKMEAKAESRRLVWLQAMSEDCGGGTLGCAGSHCGDASSIESDLGGIDGGDSGWWGTGSLLDNVLSFVSGESTRTEAQAEGWIPASLGIGSTTTKRGRNVLMCNEKPTFINQDSAIEEGRGESGILNLF